MDTRGIRNNNPLNIRKSKDKWQGLREKQTDAAFFQFQTMAYGWRAAFKLLCYTYYNKYKLRTIKSIISRWAPPNENNTSSYIKHVSETSGIGADELLGDPQSHPEQWMLIAMSMAIVECGTTQLDYIGMLKGWSMSRA